MSDYISRDALWDGLHSGNIVIYCRTPHEVKMLRKLSGEIDRVLLNIPSADVQPVRHGRWESINDLECFMCSCCGEYANQPWGKDGAIMFSYCPNCGARMEEQT